MAKTKDMSSTMKKETKKKVKVEAHVEADYSYEVVIGAVNNKEAKKIKSLSPDNFYFLPIDGDDQRWYDFGNLFHNTVFLQSDNSFKSKITIDGMKKVEVHNECVDIYDYKNSKKGDIILVSALPLKNASADISFEVELEKDEVFEPDFLYWIRTILPEEFYSEYTTGIGDYTIFDEGLIVGMAYLRDEERENFADIDKFKVQDIPYFQDYNDEGNNGYYLLKPCLIKCDW